jgi:DNA-directed RNA polymerase specialized sigma24 family protein
MPTTDSPEIDALLAKWGEGNLDARRSLIRLIYDLDGALTKLSRLHSQQGRIVNLRFFGGFSIEETAEVLGISSATVKRHWMTARIWLFQQLNGEARA